MLTLIFFLFFLSICAPRKRKCCHKESMKRTMETVINNETGLVITKAQSTSCHYQGLREKQGQKLQYKAIVNIRTILPCFGAQKFKCCGLCVKNAKPVAYTVIPRLTKIIRSGITFFSRDVISRSRCLERKQPSRVGGSPLSDVVSSFLCHTHTDGKDKLLKWPDRSCLLLYVSARIH
jgi:hypothetical protein